MQRILTAAFIWTVLCLAAWSGSGKQADAIATEANAEAGVAAVESPRVFELRTYHCNEGKLDDLHTRFKEHTCALLKKHGAELVGFWTPQDDKDGKGSTLVYLVAYPSREAAKQTWKAFQDDPEWQKARDESHKNGPLVDKVDSVFLDPTDYSAMQ